MSRIDFVGLARQAAGRGDAESLMEYYVPVETTNVTANRETLEIEETTGTRFPIGIDYGTRYYELPLVGAPRVASLPRVLSAFLGQPASSGSAPYTHTFDPTLAGKIAEWHSLIVARMDPNPPIVDHFTDARGNELSLNIAPNDYLRFEATFYALHCDEIAAPVPTTDMTQRKKFAEAHVSISEDGGTTWLAEQISAAWGITYNNNLDTDEAILGSYELYALPEGNADLEVRFSPRENMETFYRRNLLQDPDDLAIKMVATGAGGEEISVIAHSVEITDAPAPVSGADVLKMIEVTGRAKIGTTGAAAGKFVTIAVKNSVATYT